MQDDAFRVDAISGGEEGAIHRTNVVCVHDALRLSRRAAAVDDVENIFVTDFDSLWVLVAGGCGQFIIAAIAPEHVFAGEQIAVARNARKVWLDRVNLVGEIPIRDGCGYVRILQEIYQTLATR